MKYKHVILLCVWNEQKMPSFKQKRIHCFIHVWVDDSVLSRHFDSQADIFIDNWFRLVSVTLNYNSKIVIPSLKENNENVEGNIFIEKAKSKR